MGLSVAWTGGTAEAGRPSAAPSLGAASQPAGPTASSARAEAVSRLLELLTSNGVVAQDLVDGARTTLSAAGTAVDPELRSLALSVQCRGHYRLSDLAAAQRACDAAAAIAGSPLARFAVLRMQATLLAERGRPTDAIPMFLGSLSAAEESGVALAVAAALGGLGAVAQFAGANAEAVDYYERAMTLAARIGATGMSATLGSNLGYLLVEAGKARLARETFEQALQSALESGSRQAEFTIRNGLAHALLADGQADAAAVALRGLIESPSQAADAYQLAEAQLFLARAELAAGRARSAEAAARAAISGLEKRSMLRTYPAYAVLIDALVARRKLAEADALSRRYLEVVPELARGRFELLKSRSRLLTAADRYREAYAILLESERVRDAQSIARAEDRVTFMRAREQAHAREGELRNLREQQARVVATSERDRLTRNFSLLLLSLVLLGAAFYWSVVRERRKIEARISQRQHMDALGKLTGGVAHDFNNLMTVVRQAMGLLRSDPAIQASPRMLTLVDEADGAARVGGQITQQLLAFARQHPMKPEVLPVGEFLERQRPLLERSLGATMSLDLRAAPGVGAIRVDPGQLTTALINLLVNARDAMQGRGRVQLEATPVENPGGESQWPGLSAGRYVSIAVTDSGQGMTRETLEQAVTPFFTTKADGGGSGLGLSMVDGFVSQSGGALRVASTPGAGTTITAFLPQVAAESSG